MMARVDVGLLSTFSFLAVMLVVSVYLYIYKPGIPQPAHGSDTSAEVADSITQSYHSLKDSIKTLRYKLQTAYHNTHTSEERGKLCREADKLFLSIVAHRIFPFWYGTHWGFYDSTEIPRKGSIACGYFVGTVLRDMGMNVNRVLLGNMQSENMIRTLVSPENIKVYKKGLAIQDFKTQLSIQGDGLYIVGLDNHTGFLLCEHSKVYFIHASVPYVMRQEADESPFLVYSRYRVTGKLSGDAAFIRQWLSGEAFQ